jgi:DNA-binding MarR family transcriptional regulator
MTGVKDGAQDAPDHVLALLGQVLDTFRRDLGRQGRSPSGLRSSQVRLLSLTPAEGMRVTDLAERVGMTKQALGEFADDLEQRGLLESVRDPADRRVRILRPTSAGRRAVRSATRQIEAVEAQWRERLGARKWEQLRALLVEAADLSR